MQLAAFAFGGQRQRINPVAATCAHPVKAIYSELGLRKMYVK